MDRRRNISGLLAACGMVAGLAASAHGQAVINCSGATLLENFLKSNAITNDYLDVDGDGVARVFGTNDQLAPFGLPPALGHGKDLQWWIFQYRAVGSVNGYQELLDYSDVWATGPDDVELFSSQTSKAFHNRTQYINNGVSFNSIFNPGNPGAAPVRSDMVTLQATYSAPPFSSPGGIRVDFAAIDVPALWASTAPGMPHYASVPGQSGYGDNAITSLLKDGNDSGFNHKLANLGDKNLFQPGVTPDNKTLFDTLIAIAPVAPMTNLGVGMTQIKQSELRHLFITGRLPSGENIVAVTRDSGSGTRNAWMNGLCTDPSWGMGDNIGGLSVLAAEHVLGADFSPTNKVGSGQLETTVQNHRLAIGYTGAERAVNSALVTGGRMEMLAVQSDLQGGILYVRPNINTLLDNDANGYNITGPAVFTSLGDPLAAPLAKGGAPGNSNPPMLNVEAAAMLNNITASVAAFSGAPGSSATLFTPGEFLAVNFIPVAATDFAHGSPDPCVLVPNPALNLSLQQFVRDPAPLGAGSVYLNPVFFSFGTVTLNGVVPTRAAVPGVYSDAALVPGGTAYITQGGAVLNYATPLNNRNRIAGDFNGDGRRDLNDAAEMVKAWRQRNGGPAWVAPNGTGPIAGAPGADACIEILGDFNGDGSFDAADLRYWADGLAVDPATGKLDRAKGFKAIDDAFVGSFFGTTWANGQTYQHGDSRLDVAKPSGLVTPGFAPIGADGIIGHHDTAYICANKGNWASLANAVGMDLSADVTGDLVVDGLDVRAACNADCEGDCDLDIFDFLCFQNEWAANSTYGDCENDGDWDVFDFLCFQNLFAGGC